MPYARRSGGASPCCTPTAQPGTSAVPMCANTASILPADASSAAAVPIASVSAHASINVFMFSPVRCGRDRRNSR